MSISNGSLIQDLLENRSLCTFIKKIIVDMAKYKLDVMKARRIWQIGMNAYLHFEADYQERTRDHG